MTDKQRIDWLDSLTTFTWEETRDSFRDSPTFDKVVRRTLFTIPSQHVPGKNLRDAIDKAMKKVGSQ